MLSLLKVLIIFLGYVIFIALLLLQAFLKQLLVQDRLKYLRNGIGLGFMANVPSLIITLRPTWVDVRRQDNNVHAPNINNPIPSIPFLLCLHSWHSLICRTHFILVHLKQRYRAGQFPYSCQRGVFQHYIFQLARKLSRIILRYLHLSYIPLSRLSELFSVRGSFLSWSIHQAACVHLR